MKLITLNIWGGKKSDQLEDFFRKYRSKVDLFCLQEVNNFSPKTDVDVLGTPNILSRIYKILVHHNYLFHPAVEDQYGLATFVSDTISLSSDKNIFVAGSKGDSFDFDEGIDHPRNMQCLEFQGSNGGFYLHNIHGAWKPGDKDDTERRLQQSNNIVSHIEEHEIPQIICGDFNLRPDTESMEIIESAGFRNLITEHGITDTRTSFYDKEERFADYILVSEKITVNDFQVLSDEVSDHAPLLLDFTL